MVDEDLSSFKAFKESYKHPEKSKQI